MHSLILPTVCHLGTVGHFLLASCATPLSPVGLSINYDKCILWYKHYPVWFHIILSNTILSAYHFVHIILSVPFCPLSQNRENSSLSESTASYTLIIRIQTKEKTFRLVPIVAKYAG